MGTTYPKLILFDLDGVLLDSKEIHFEAFNKALFANGYEEISKEDHLAHYDGLPTKEKLIKYCNLNGIELKQEHYDRIWKDKQQFTLYAFDRLEKDEELRVIFFELRLSGYQIAVASNSIRRTLYTILHRLGIMDLCDFVCSNEDVYKGKPYPEMYWKCMQAAGSIPQTTWIIEDSHIGRQGAIDSGSHLIPVNNRESLTLEFIEEHLKGTEERKLIPWSDKKLNVLIPMAGEGSRFTLAGYTFPKPLIEVRGKPMIQVVIDNLNIAANYIFLVRTEHREKYNLDDLFRVMLPECKISVINVNMKTQGAACTTLFAENEINNDNPLIIANSDQFVEWNSNEVMYAFSADKECDAGILTFKASHPKWSYAKVGENGYVTEVAEKRIISDNATVGVYYWKHGSDYVKYAKQMILKNIRTNNEFYVCPVFNEAIADGKKVRIKQIDKMWGIGTPEDLNYFLENYKGEI